MERATARNFRAFTEEFPRLKHPFKDLIALHFSLDIFKSDLAKSKHVAPDLPPFN